MVVESSTLGAEATQAQRIGRVVVHVIWPPFVYQVGIAACDETPATPLLIPRLDVQSTQVAPGA